MKKGDLVSINTVEGNFHTGVVIDLDDDGYPDREAQILWDDGKIQWEKCAPLCVERGDK